MDEEAETKAIEKWLRMVDKPLETKEREKKEVEQTINKWFEETRKVIKEKKPMKELDLLLANCVLCADKYSNTILCLISDGHKLPTQALLRVLLEFYIKLLWCTHVPDHLDMTEKEKHVYEKVGRWDYRRVIEHKKLLSNMLVNYEDKQKRKAEESISQLENDCRTYKDRGLKCMPNVAGLFKKLGGEWESSIYPKIYQNFSSAVHLDMRVVREFVKFDRDRKQINEYRDINYSMNDLIGYCASMSCDINHMIRNFYGFSSDNIQEDYKKIDRNLRK